MKAATPPLLLALHGLGDSGEMFAQWFGAKRLAAELGAVLAAPDGRRDARGRGFWNATRACCDFFGAGGDDVSYLESVIRLAVEQEHVDPRRIFVLGYSNGAFMAHRLACDAHEPIAAIVAVSGMAPTIEEGCRSPGGIRVLELHGALDPVVRPGGGRVFDDPSRLTHPSARDSVRGWALRNGCSPATQEGAWEAFYSGAPELPVRVLRHAGCERGAAELWTLEGVAHAVRLDAVELAAVAAFLR